MALIFSHLPNAGGVWTVGAGKAVGWICFFPPSEIYLQVNKVLRGARTALLNSYCPETPPKQAQTMKGIRGKNQCISVWVHLTPSLFPFPFLYQFLCF